MPRIEVINPNSNRMVTAKLSSELERIAAGHSFEIACTTLEEGPFGIETDEHIAAVVPLLLARIRALDGASAVVIACYSDPGLAECRAAATMPVYGIHESALRMAAGRGRPFAVLALSEGSIHRHLVYVRSLGLGALHVGERSLEMSVDEACNAPDAPERIIEVGRKLIDETGAESIILGCAGMAAHRKAVQTALEAHVIEPVEAAVLEAIR